MSLNVIELLDSVIRDAQVLLDELRSQKDVQRHLQTLLKAAQDVHTETMKYAEADGSITDVPFSSSYNTRTPFAIFATQIYVLKIIAEKVMNSLSSEQLQTLESMETKMNRVMRRLFDIWGIE